MLRAITLPSLHPAQIEIAKSPARFKVVACGRRWGKTTLGAVWAMRAALRGRAVWWVAPTYALAWPAWSLAKDLARQIPGSEIRESERRVQFGNGWFAVKSADDPNALRGVGLDLVIVDEAAFCAEETWTAALRPALSDRRGAALFISTPNGQNWFHRAYQRGLDPQYPNWQSWRFKTADSPFVTADEIAEARASLPEQVFSQEYEAEFTADAGRVFRRVREAVYTGVYEPPTDYREVQTYLEGRYQTVREYAPHTGRFVMGVDWGMARDFTVLTVLDCNVGAVVALDRFNQISWEVQRDRALEMARRWKVEQSIVESNSIGDPQIEALRKDGLDIWAITTTNTTKADYIRALVLAFEQGTIKIPDDPVLIGELEAYEVERLESGRYRYGAPPGMHDDTVISLALAWHGNRRNRPAPEQQPFLR